MLTNKIGVTYNKENIDTDFDIFIVEKGKNDYYRHNILDSALYDFKAAAVQWSFGEKALVLFRKGDVTEEKFRKSIRDEYADVTIQKIDLFDEEQCKNCFYRENRLLAQLLINSMRTPKDEDYKYNNLTGKLLIMIDKDESKGVIRFLEIVIDPDMYLNLAHRTYMKHNQEGYGLYVIDEKTGEFRKKLKADRNKDLVTYKLKSIPGKHFRVDNFDITNIDRFRKSKLGVMEQFLRDANEILSRYMKIELVEREDSNEYNLSVLEKKGLSEQDYGEMLQKKGVVIVDENNSVESKEIVAKLQRELEEFYHVEASVGRLSSDAYNIRVIHDNEYYEENELEDPHSDDLKGYIVQHITEEGEHFVNEKKSSPDIKKIIQELIIKGDVRDQKISIYDWDRLDSGKEWNFVIREKVKKQGDEDTKHRNYANENEEVSYYYNYYKMKINCNGSLEFDTFCDINEEESEEWRKICFAFDHEEKKHYGNRDQVEGAVYSDEDNIQIILLTRERTLPNIAALREALVQTDAKEKVSKDLLLTAIEEFEVDNTDSRKDILEWKKKISEEARMISKGAIKKIVNMKKKIGKKFNRFLHEKYDVWIYGELRNSEFEAIYQIGNILNIKYEYNDEDYLDGKSFLYYVGAKTKNNKYPNACCMRKVVSVGDTIEYEDLLPLMAVEFVRNSQHTVIPFPFKYLREYVKQL